MRTLISRTEIARSAGSALFSHSWVELNSVDLDIADQNSEVRGVRVIHLAPAGLQNEVVGKTPSCLLILEH